MPIFKNKIFIATVSAILSIAIVAGLIFYYNYRRDRDIESQLLAKKNKELEEIKKSWADYEVMRQANITKDDKKCRSLEDKARDGCFYSMAGSYLEVKYCDEIINEEYKKQCQDIFTYNNIIKNDDSQTCYTLQTNFYKKNCLEHFFSKLEDLGGCEKFTAEDKTRCKDVVNKKQAYAENNIKICDNVGDKFMRNDCRQIIKSKPKDSDNDGLTDSEELSYSTDAFKADMDNDGLNDLDELSKYFTDPKSQDTDGDGYKDGDEVKDGFDPKKP